MKTILFPILVLLFGFLCEASAQNQKTVDSLTAVLSTKVAGDRYSPLYELTFEYLDRNNEMALHFIEEAEQAALLSGDSLWIVKSSRVHGQILYRLDRIREAILSFDTGLRIANQNEFDGESKLILSALGLCHLFRGEFDKALLKFDTAAQLAKQEADTIMLIQNLNNTGITYFQLHDPEKALIYHLKVLKIEEQANYSEVESWADINISLCYSWLHQYATAAAYLKKSLDKCRNGCSEKRRMHNEFASALIYQGMNEPNLALNKFFSSLALAKKRGGPRMIFDNLVRISDVLIMENRLNEAESYLKDAEELIFRKAPFPIEQINVYWKFCQVYEKLGDYRHLAFYQHKYIYLKDSILNNEITNRLMKAESEFKARESRARIASQGQVILFNEGIIHRQRLLNIVTGLLALVTLVFAVFIFLSYRRKQHLNKLLEEKVRARTMELEHSRDEMLRMLEEKDLRMRQASVAIANSVNSIEGLCLTGRKEIAHPMADSYLKRIKHISSGIVMSLRESLHDGVLQQVH